MPDRRYFTESENSNNSDSDSHSVNLGFDIKVDSTFLINIKPTLSYTELKSIRKSESASFDENRLRTNAAELESVVESQNSRFKNDLDFTKKYGNDGGFVKLNFMNEWRDTQGEDYIFSETNIYGQNPSEEIRDQYTDAEKKYTNYYTRLTYRMPLLSKKLFFDLKYIHGYQQTLDAKSVYDFNDDSQNYSIFNTDLSTDYTFTDIRSAPQASIIYNTEKTSLDVGVGYAFRKLQGTDDLRPELEVNNRYEALEMYARGSVNFSSTSRLYLGYTLKNDAPLIQNMLPNTDVSDPLNIINGNPDLKPIDKHSLYLYFTDYDYQKGVGYYAYLNADTYENAVVPQTMVDENNIRRTTFANVNGKQSISGNISTNRKFKLDSLISITPRIGSDINYSEDVNFNNGFQYKSHNLSINPNVGLTLSWQKVFDLKGSYSLVISKNSFKNSLFEERNYLRHSLRLETSLFVPKNFEWRNDINYSYNPDITEGFQKSALFWNSSIAYSMIENKGTLTLKVYDLLNQNTNASRYSSENYIQDSQSTVLKQYFMLSFSYKFNTLGSKGDTGRGDIYFD